MLNYGFVPMGEFGNVQRMSITFKFGDKGGPGKYRGKAKRYVKAEKRRVNW